MSRLRWWWLLASRIVLAGTTRSVITLLLTAIPVAVVAAAVGAAHGAVTTAEQKAAILTGGHDAALSIGDRPIPKALASTLGAKARIAADQLDVIDIPLMANDAGVTARYLESEWAKVETAPLYRLTNGILPEGSGQVAVSDNAAAQLHLGIGSVVVLANDPKHPATVTGTFVQRRMLSGNIVLAGPGTWTKLVPPELTLGSLVPFRTLFIDYTDPTAPVDLSTVSGGTMTAASQATTDPFFLQQPVLLVAPVLILLGAVVAGGFLLALRRMQTDLGVLSAYGLSARALKRLLSFSCLLVTLAGLVLGLVVGVILGPWAGDILAGSLDREVSSAPHPHIIDLLVLGGVIVVVSTLTAAIMGRMVVRGVADGSASRSLADAVPVRQGGTGRRRAIQALAIAALLVSLVFLRDGAAGSLISVAAVMVFLALTAGDLLDGIGFGSRRSGPALMLGGLLVRRDHGRSTVMAGVVMAAVCLVVGVSTSNQSWFERNLAVREPTVSTGMIRINSHSQELPATALAAVEKAAGAPASPRACLADLRYTGCWAIPIADEMLEVYVVRSTDEIRLLTSYLPTAADVDALSAGRLLMVGAGVSASTNQNRLVDSRGHAQKGAVAATSASGAVPKGAKGVFVVATALAAQSLRPHVEDYWIIAPADRADAIRSAVAPYAVPSSDVQVDRPPTEAIDPWSAFALWVGGVLGFIIAGWMMLLLLVERRRTGDQLSMLGMATRAARAVGILGYLIPLAVGAIAGSISGLAVAWIRLLGVPVSLAVSWPVLGYVGVAVTGLVVLAVMLAPRPDLARYGGTA